MGEAAASDNPVEALGANCADGLFSADSYTGHHDSSFMTRKRLPGGGLSIAWRAPEWALPPLPSDLELASFAPLLALKERSACPNCHKSRHYYCHTCLRALTPETTTPTLTLPFQIELILHPHERLSMATGVHAALLAPAQVRISTLQNLPWDLDPAGTVLLFPSQGARDVGEVDLGKIKRVIVVESKWKGAAKILSLPELANVPHIRLRAVKTSFWRYHTKGTTSDGLSTIEAILSLCREWHHAQWETKSGRGIRVKKVRKGDGDGEGEREGEGDGGEGVVINDKLSNEGGSRGGNGSGLMREVRDVGVWRGEGVGGCKARVRGGKCHCFDNLLWYFAFLHGVIEGDMGGGELGERVKREEKMMHESIVETLKL